MSEGSEARKTSRNEQEPSNPLRQRCSFCPFSACCSFYESPDDGSWACDESLSTVRALFLAVAVVDHACPTPAKGWAVPAAPRPTPAPSRGSAHAASSPETEAEPAQAGPPRT